MGRSSFRKGVCSCIDVQHKPCGSRRRDSKGNLYASDDALLCAAPFLGESGKLSLIHILSANRGEIDPQEMQQHERLLCEADLQAEQAHLARERLEKLADSPYFARVSFVPDGEGSMPQVAGTHADGDTTAEGDAAARGHAATDGKAPTLDAYIGRFSFGDADGTVVSDWRSPVASLFYDLSLIHI